MKEKPTSVLGILSLIFGLTSFLILLLAFITEIHNSFNIENIMKQRMISLLWEEKH